MIAELYCLLGVQLVDGLKPIGLFFLPASFKDSHSYLKQLGFPTK
jgi:hypothetical protein